MKKLLSLILLSTFLISCSTEEFVEEIVIDYEKLDDELIRNYLTENNITATKTNSGLYYYIEKEGNGNYPNQNSNVTTYLKGYFLDDKVFSGSDTTEIDLNLSLTIDGFKEGVTYIKEGGKGTIFIPSGLGYKENGNPFADIPPNTILVYDVELLKIY